MENRDILPFFPGQEIKNVECIDISNMGFGVLKPLNFTVFAKGLIVGEKADIRIDKVSKHFAIASVLNITNKSLDRREVTAADAKENNAYKYLHISYPAQIKIKEKQLYDLFGYKVGVIASDQEFYYRNKIGYTIHKGRYSMYEDKNKMYPIDWSIIAHKEINKIMPFVLEAINNNKKAKIKEVVFRYSEYQNAIMIIFVSDIDNYYANKIAQEIVGYSNKVKSVILNIGSSSNYLFNEDEKVLYGEDHLIDKIFNKLFKITSKSFYQINNKQTEKLYQLVIDFGEFTLEDNILDLYCGVGSIALTLSDYVNHVLGIEVLKEAVDSALQNIELNDVHNVDIERMDLNENFLIDENINCIVVDPPRSGLSSNVISRIKESSVNKIIYVSCNPTTQKRDIDLFALAGYKVKKHQAVDMFANTEHVEMVVLLTRVEK